jgi:hypothetical protein
MSVNLRVSKRILTQIHTHTHIYTHTHTLTHTGASDADQGDFTIPQDTKGPQKGILTVTVVRGVQLRDR